MITPAAATPTTPIGTIPAVGIPVATLRPRTTGTKYVYPATTGANTGANVEPAAPTDALTDGNDTDNAASAM